MSTATIEDYVAAFVARCDAVRRLTSQIVNEPGLHGLVSSSEDSPTRLLVTDDRSHDVLAVLMPRVRAGTISVFAAAPRSTDVVANSPGWTSNEVTAMINRDLRTLPEVPLPGGLMVRPVRRLDDDPVDGVSLQDAVAAALADPASDQAPEMLAEHLRSMPPTVRLFAAVDDGGVVRATSGSGTFGAQATVFLVNTHPSWRRRGIGRAMTAVALLHARNAGASRASLDASDAAIPICLRLGFEIVAGTTQFFRAS